MTVSAAIAGAVSAGLGLILLAGLATLTLVTTIRSTVAVRKEHTA